MTTVQLSTIKTWYWKLPWVQLGEYSSPISTTFYLSQLICIPRMFFHIDTYVNILLLNYLMLRTHSYSWFWWGCFHNLFTNESDGMRIRAAGRADVDADRRPLLVDGSVVAVFIYDTWEIKRTSLFICLRFRFCDSFFILAKFFFSFYFTFYQFL